MDCSCDHIKQLPGISGGGFSELSNFDLVVRHYGSVERIKIFRNFKASLEDVNIVAKEIRLEYNNFDLLSMSFGRWFENCTVFLYGRLSILPYDELALNKWELAGSSPLYSYGCKLDYAVVGLSGSWM